MKLPSLLLLFCIHFFCKDAFAQKPVSSTPNRFCNRGFFDNGNGCIPCPPGTIAPDRSAVFCTPCPAGLYPNIPLELDLGYEDSRVECVSCGKGRFIAPNGECLPCPRGTYWDEDVAGDECKKCPPEKPFSSDGLTTPDRCFGCERGTSFFEDSGGVACELCNPGTFQPLENQLTCVPCPPGTVSDFDINPSEDSCKPCPAGTFGVTTPSESSCKKCSFRRYKPVRGSGGCRKCPEGSRGDARHERCIPNCNLGFARCKKLACPPGTQPKNMNYPKDAKNLRCESCPVDKFNPTFSTSECVSCPQTMMPNAARTACICKPNLFRFRGQMSCSACPKGSTVLNEFECKCPAGKFFRPRFSQPCNCLPFNRSKDFSVPAVEAECRPCTPRELRNSKAGSGSCVLCESGEVFDEKRNKCVKCPRGKTTDLGDKKCKPCKLSYRDADGKRTCGCRPGQVQSGSTCKLCPAGTAAKRSRNQCEACRGWKFSDKPGSTKCKSCPPGRRYAKVFENNKKCPPLCPEGASGSNGKCFCKAGYATRGPRNDLRCQKCPKGQTSSGTFFGRSVCVCKKSGFERKGGKCVPCQPGFVAGPDDKRCRPCGWQTVPNRERFACEGCPVGTFTFRNDSTECVKCEAGQFVTKDDGCSSCKPGFRVRSGKCVRCSEGVSPGGDVSFCAECPEGKVPDNSRATCIDAKVDG